MEAQIIINTDATGKNLYESSQEFCEGMPSSSTRYIIGSWRSKSMSRWKKVVNTCQDFSIVKKLYQLQALFVIASSDLSVIISQMYPCKIKLQHLFFNRQLNSCIYEAHNTYIGHEQFIRNWCRKLCPFSSVAGRGQAG